MPMSIAVLKDTWDSRSVNLTVWESRALTSKTLESVPRIGEALAGSMMAL